MHSTGFDSRDSWTWYILHFVFFVGMYTQVEFTSLLDNQQQIKFEKVQVQYAETRPIFGMQILNIQTVDVFSREFLEFLSCCDGRCTRALVKRSRTRRHTDIRRQHHESFFQHTPAFHSMMKRQIQLQSVYTSKLLSVLHQVSEGLVFPWHSRWL